MPNVKDEIRRMLDELPDDVTYEDIQYELHVRRKIEQGLAAMDEGRVVSHEEARQRLAQWLEP